MNIEDSNVVPHRHCGMVYPNSQMKTKYITFSKKAQKPNSSRKADAQSRRKVRWDFFTITSLQGGQHGSIKSSLTYRRLKQ